MSKTKQEQVTAVVGSLQPKSVFNYGGVNWLVLGRKGGGVLCLAEKILFDKAFDDEICNNWEDSSLREHLNNDFLEELINNGATEAAFLPMVTDLTANDGLKDYGRCEDLITLLSCEQYRQYRSIISNADDWWWTCTPYSTMDNGYEHSMCCVKSDGAVICGNYPWDVGSSIGVRLACDISSDTLVSVIKAGDYAEKYDAGAEATAADGEDGQDTPTEWFADDIRTQKAIDGFYDCIEVAQQRYKEGTEDYTNITSAMSLIKYPKGDLPF